MLLQLRKSISSNTTHSSVRARPTTSAIFPCWLSSVTAAKSLPISSKPTPYVFLYFVVTHASSDRRAISQAEFKPKKRRTTKNGGSPETKKQPTRSSGRGKGAAKKTEDEDADFQMEAGGEEIGDGGAVPEEGRSTVTKGL